MDLNKFIYEKAREYLRKYGRPPRAMVSERTARRIGHEIRFSEWGREYCRWIPMGEYPRFIGNVEIETRDVMQTGDADILVFYSDGYGAAIVEAFEIELPNVPPWYPKSRKKEEVSK